MKKHLIIASLILATTSFSFAATTANTPKVKQNETPQKQEMQRPQRPNLDQILNLTEEQKEKAKEVRMQGHKQMKPIMEELKSKGEQKYLLMQNKNAGVKEAEKLEKLNKEIVNLRNQADKIRQQNNKQFEAILTADQLKKFNELKKEGRRDFEKRHHAKPFGPMDCNGPKKTINGDFPPPPIKD